MAVIIGATGVAFHRPDVVPIRLPDLDRHLSLSMQSIANHYFIAQIHPA